jgi:protein TonB
MRRIAESLAFLCLATAVHAGAWLGFGGAAAPGAGSGGAAALTLEAASGDLAAMVQRWDAPPEVAAPTATMVTPEAVSAPEVPTALPPATPPAAQTPPPPPVNTDRPALPQIADTAPRPDPVRPRPRPEPPAAPAQAAAPAPATPAEAQPAQRASGAGQQQSSGQSGASAATGPSAGQLRALEAEWGGAILARIARAQRYPSGNHGAGTARVVLSVGRDGRLQSVGLDASSGSAGLDRAALDAVRRAGRFPAAPRELAKAAYVFRVPMTFRRN